MFIGVGKYVDGWVCEDGIVEGLLINGCLNGCCVDLELRVGKTPMVQFASILT